MYQIKHSLERSLALHEISNAPSLQDMVNVALKRLIRDWQDSEQQNLLHDELLDLKDVDLADIRIGTLHSLCNDILQEYRHPDYQNVRRSHSLLKTTLEEAATSLREDFRSRLVSLGQYLFQSLLPEELQNTFRTIASFKLPFTLLILADQDAWFPWELLHDGQKFLGDRSYQCWRILGFLASKQLTYCYTNGLGGGLPCKRMYSSCKS